MRLIPNKKRGLKRKIKRKDAAVRAPNLNQHGRLEEVTQSPAKRTHDADLFPQIAGTRPVAEKWATALQLSPIIGMDDAGLRRLADKNNLNPETNEAWIPKPIRGQWPVLKTISGWAAWMRHKMTKQEERGLPRQCSSMKDLEAVYGIPVEMQQYARIHGCSVAFDSSNRVNVLPLLKFFTPLLLKIFSGGGKHIEGIEAFDELDLNEQRARLTSAQAIEQERLNALAEQRLHDREDCEQTFRLEYLVPLRDGLQKMMRKFNRFKGANGQGHEIAFEIVSRDWPQFMDLLRAGLPEAAVITAESIPLSAENASDFTI